ncbi:hypothetical protein BDV97DRAFT_348601 [Delphinella strobiligena]|nr:hypothetical protein BDV97DRAFT_348601 [Delphinella strobiligena]
MDNRRRPTSSRQSHLPVHTSTSRSSSRNTLQASHYSIEPPSTPQAPSGFDKGKGPATDTDTIGTTRQQIHSDRTLHGHYDDNDNENDNGVESPVDESSAADNFRPLSWSSVTHDSVVDNLLSSFDRMPGGQDVTTLDDEFAFAASTPRMHKRFIQRARGHTYSSSLSTDKAGSDDTASSYSRNLSSRDQQSNSNSSYLIDSPASMPRIRDGRSTMLSRSSSETQTIGRNDLHSRVSVRKGSKSSGASSFDMFHGHSGASDSDMLHGQAMASSRAASHLSARSPSRDNEYTQSAPEILSNSILERGRPVPSLYSAYEPHCPEPNVPRHPRKDSDKLAPSTSHSCFSGPPQKDEASYSDNVNSSVMSQDIPKSIRDQASDFVRASNMRFTSPAPSSASPSTHMSVPTNDANAQQRPGFFRRVFGSSVSNRSSSGTEIQKQFSRESSVINDTPQQPTTKSIPNATHLASLLMPESNPFKQTSSPATSSPAPAPANPVINKKPSFFRRRKKSVSDDSAPPTLPQHFLAEQQDPPSPGTSSLRKVLDPYLVDADLRTPTSQIPLSRFATESPDGDSDSLDYFHSGYTPPPDATLRRPAPLEHRSSVCNKATIGNKPDRGEDMRAPKPRSPPDATKLQVKAADKRPAMLRRTSYLSDASDVDDREDVPSFVSAISESYSLPGHFSPVSPLGSPSSEIGPDDTFFPSPLFPSPSATIRAVNKTGHASGGQWDYGVKESKGLAITIPSEAKNDRLWINSDSPDEGLVTDELFEGPISPRALAPSQSKSDFHRDNLPVVEVNGNQVRPSVDIARQHNTATGSDPTAEDIEHARQIYHGNEHFVPKAQAAAWLGERTPISARTLVAYMSFFDWTGQNILKAMRGLCEKLVLKGESQQVDRILEAFATRWHECNPRNGFKGQGVIHNICYALLLLNTDHHIANIQHKMTKSEFVKNTMPAVTNSIDRTIKPVKRSPRPALNWQDSTWSVPDSPTIPHMPKDEDEDKLSIDLKRSMKRLSIRPGIVRNETDPGPGGADVNNHASNALVNYDWEGSDRGWFLEVETVLKSFYLSIVADALPLNSANEKDRSASFSPTDSLGVNSRPLRRTGSVISKSPSEGYMYRGRKISDTQTMAQRMHSKNRTKQRSYPASANGSSRASLDDSSMISPAGSSMWSKISNGRTQPTMSVESLALTADFKQSLGFTNALSQAIIREEHEATSDSESFHRVGSLLEDESLELAGAPWAKEGMVKHKHHLEGPEKKAKERSWNECFAVVEKGYLHLFAFNRKATKISAGNIRSRRNTASAKTPGTTPSVVGGGNWTDNAEELGQYLLRQSIATALPAPGYSKSRPYVWALSLPTGAVHLFQVGTAEIAEEFATTANYWSARLSKEPLVGGVDNIEYGWSDNVLNPALVSNLSPPPSRSGASVSAPGHAPSSSVNTITKAPRPSTQSSLRASIDQGFGNRPRLPGDRVNNISEWRPPASSMLPSQLLEIDQLRSLRAYISSVEAELQKHNELRHAIPLAYSGNGAKLGKVMANWQKKSEYLLKEAVRFSTYIEVLEHAGACKEKVYEERRIREEENAAIAAANRERDRLPSVATM